MDVTTITVPGGVLCFIFKSFITNMSYLIQSTIRFNYHKALTNRSFGPTGCTRFLS